MKQEMLSFERLNLNLVRLLFAADWPEVAGEDYLKHLLFFLLLITLNKYKFSNIFCPVLSCSLLILLFMHN